jgi:alkanesulfonate monooxygenase SsuD/methylene tetrahydromethanopterin reductase-like flavin-dependent oxidoreductase (luciferase family)
MQFAIMIDSHIDKWPLIRRAEELGYDRAYVPDSEMIWSDCHAILALAAANTRRIALGTGVSNPGSRLAPVTACAIATINRIAPGRVFLGLGTGHTSMRLVGRPPASLSHLREYVRVVRALLDGEEVDYPYQGQSRLIKFMHRDRAYLDLDHRIPIYLAANAAQATQLAGEIADGWITHTIDPAVGAAGLQRLQEGAHRVGRSLPAHFHTTFQTTTCVLRPGENLRSERVIDWTGAHVACVLHIAWEQWNKSGRRDETVPRFFADIWEEYVAHVERMSLPPAARFRQIHEGHCTFVTAQERRFITSEAIAAICLVGTPNEIVGRIRAMEQIGFNEVHLYPPADCDRAVFEEFAQFVMPAFR